MYEISCKLSSERVAHIGSVGSGGPAGDTPRGAAAGQRAYCEFFNVLNHVNVNVSLR